MAANFLLAAETPLEDPNDEVWAVRWATGSHAVTAGLKGVTRVWNAADQEAPSRLELPAQDHLAVVGLDVDPSPSAPRYLVTSALDSVLCRYSLEESSAGTLEARKATPPTQSWAIALHPSGSEIMMTCGGDARAHIMRSSVDAFAESLAVLEGRGKFALCCGFSPDGSLCAIGSDSGQVSVFEAETGQLVQSFPAHSETIRTVAFSADSSMILTGSDDKRVNAFDLRRPSGGSSQQTNRSGGQVLSLAGHTGWVTALKVRGDGRVLASGSTDGTVKIWDLQRPQSSLSTLQDSEKEVWALDWRPEVPSKQVNVVEGIGLGGPAGGALLVGSGDGVRWYRATGK